ncbi:MAG: DUF853 domain-containing protein [Xanthomonadales bacterium]|jgi:hypothetical protein|nr:DUF853 domain-containing protein [Xanthomonadales bacterium]
MNPILIARGQQDVHLLPKFGNRHGLIAGATGTGKTVSLMTLAEAFSQRGTPVFLADVKGDLGGLGQPAEIGSKLQQRLTMLALHGYRPAANPLIFWDLYGQRGHPLRATVSEIGPLLLARMLDLNDTQEGVLNVLFRVADEEGLLLLDLKDLRAMLAFVSENAKSISAQYGLVAPQSVAAIQRALLGFENDGAEAFLGEPGFELGDFFQVDPQGRGAINLLAADRLILKPRLYSSFLLWLLSELFEQLPEVGDLEQPRLVFFFDEAHLLFRDSPPALVKRVEQVVRLIRSKGVGVYFVSQHPDDVPEMILGQLGNRIQHALRAFTPRDQKSVRTAAETFPPNPEVDVVRAITELGVGEALVSTLQEGGKPLPVQRAWILPPQSRIGTLTDAEQRSIRQASPVAGKYEQTVDRESAFEQLKARAAAAAAPLPPPVPAGPPPSGTGQWGRSWPGAATAPPPLPPMPGPAPRTQQPFPEAAPAPASRRRAAPAPAPAPAPRARSSREPESAGAAFAKSLARAAGSQLGRQILRGVLGAITRR